MIKQQTSDTKYKYSKCLCGASFLASATYIKHNQAICNRCKKDITKRLELKKKYEEI